LQNVIERALILTEPGQLITAAVLGPLFPVSLRTSSQENGAHTQGITFPEDVLPLDEVEQRYILHVLKKAMGNRTQAAQLLGISIRTLRNKLNQIAVDN
jgi:transcriptional regulator with PAS, ATPase and Fis domain